MTFICTQGVHLNPEPNSIFIIYKAFILFNLGGGLICTDFDTNFNQGTSLDQLLESSPIFNFQEPEQENEH